MGDGFSLSFGTRLSENTINNIIGKNVSQYQDQFTGNIWGNGYGTSSYGYTGQKQSFGDSLLQGLASTGIGVLGGLIQVGVASLLSCFWGGGGSASSVDAADAADGQSGASGTRTAADIQKERANVQGDRDRLAGQITILESQIASGSAETKTILDAEAKKLFGEDGSRTDEQQTNQAIKAKYETISRADAQIKVLEAKNSEITKGIGSTESKVAEAGSRAETFKQAAENAEGLKNDTELTYGKQLDEIATKIAEAKDDETDGDQTAEQKRAELSAQRDNLIAQFEQKKSEAETQKKTNTSQYYASLKEKAEAQKELEAQKKEIDKNKAEITQQKVAKEAAENELKVIQGGDKNSVKKYHDASIQYETYSPASVQTKWQEDLTAKKAALQDLDVKLENLNEEYSQVSLAEAKKINQDAATRQSNMKTGKAYGAATTRAARKQARGDMSKSDAKDSYKEYIADQQWENYSKWKNNAKQTITREQFNEIVHDIRYGKLNNNVEGAIKAKLTKLGYSAPTS